MQTDKIGLGLLTSIALVLAASTAVAADAENSKASKAVAAAFDAELRGDTTARSASLERALAIDPSNSLARSMLGYVRDKDRWVGVEELVDRWTSDPVIAGYTRLRNQVQATPQGQLMLARYCSKHDLRERGDFHWRLVLAAQPDSGEATKALGLKRHRGALMTAEQIERFEAAREKHSDLRKKVRDLVEALKSDDAEAAAALDELRALRDANAVPALFNIAGRSDEPQARAALDALIAIPAPQATVALTRLAMMARHEPIAVSAATALRDRPPTEFMPLLLGALATPIRVTGEVQQIAEGMVYSFSVNREGPTADFTHRLHGVTRVRGTARAQDVRRLNARNTQGAASQFARLSRNAAITNQVFERQNAKVFAVLTTATQQQLEPRPQAWWDWWAEQNDVYQPKYKPEIETYSRRDYEMFFPPVGCECFLAGTLVWTDRGQERIENLRAGDRVLTCHPDTGELSFRFIWATTVRPAKETTRLRLHNEDIVSTDGHPMWVIGKGWKMAKDIKSGDRLRGVRETLTVDQVEKGPESQVYNLIVDGVNNYFVGKSGVLAHDNTMRRPTRCDIPGHVAVKD